MSIPDIGNWIVLFIYVVILYKSIQIFLNIHKASLYGVVQPLVYAFSGFLALQSVIFILLQIEWIIEENNDAITDIASWGWMFYDYFNGFSVLCFAMALDIYINWRVPGSKHSRRREDNI